MSDPASAMNERPTDVQNAAARDRQLWTDAYALLERLPPADANIISRLLDARISDGYEVGLAEYDRTEAADALASTAERCERLTEQITEVPTLLRRERRAAIDDAVRVILSGIIASEKTAQFVAENVHALAIAAIEAKPGDAGHCTRQGECLCPEPPHTIEGEFCDHWEGAPQQPAEKGRETTETPGEWLKRLGADASKWAAEFRKTAIKLGYSDMDEGWLIGWFANAIEHSHAIRLQSPAPATEATRDDFIPGVRGVDTPPRRFSTNPDDIEGDSAGDAPYVTISQDEYEDLRRSERLLATRWSEYFNRALSGEPSNPAPAAEASKYADHIRRIREAADGALNSGYPSSGKYLHEAAEAFASLAAAPSPGRKATGEVSVPRDLLMAIAAGAKNDAMMMESLSRHQPVPGTETAEIGDTACNAMLAVNQLYHILGKPMPFALNLPLWLTEDKP